MQLSCFGRVVTETVRGVGVSKASVDSVKRRWSVREGPLQMMLASFILTIMIGLVKSVRTELTTSEVVFWRGILAIPLAGLIAWPAGFRVRNTRGMVVRCGFGISAMWLYYAAAVGLSLADITLLGKLRPLLLAGLSPLFLGAAERAGRGLWLLIVVGLAGCALIVQPGLAVGSSYGLIALAGVVVAAGAHLSLRWLGRTEDPRTVVFWFQVSIALVMGVLLWVGGDGIALPPGHLWLPLCGIAVCATLGQLALTRAYQVERAVTVAVASYIGPVYAVVGDVLFFGGWPTVQVFIGGAFVVGSGVFVAFRWESEAERSERGQVRDGLQ